MMSRQLFLEAKKLSYPEQIKLCRDLLQEIPEGHFDDPPVDEDLTEAMDLLDGVIKVTGKKDYD